MSKFWQFLGRLDQWVTMWMNRMTGVKLRHDTETYRDRHGVYRAVSGKVSKWKRFERGVLKILGLLIVIIIFCLVLKIIFSVLMIALAIFGLLLMLFFIRRRL